MFKKINLINKTALVTGAGKGLGKACAIALAEAGAKVIIISRTLSDLDKEQIINLIMSELETLKNEVKKLTEEYVIQKCKSMYIRSFFFKNKQKKYMCNICISEVDTLYTFDKCGHCFCENCINHNTVTTSKRCPICRQQFSSKIRLFL